MQRVIVNTPQQTNNTNWHTRGSTAVGTKLRFILANPTNRKECRAAAKVSQQRGTNGKTIVD